MGTAQKMKFSIKGLFSKCDQIRRKLRIWSHSLKKSLMENFIFQTPSRIKDVDFVKANEDIIHIIVSCSMISMRYYLPFRHEVIPRVVYNALIPKKIPSYQKHSRKF